jgi:riboflavin kinase/FMN adenylyltransferase
MMNIGKNPTIDIDKETKIEVHLFEFNEDIYDQTIQIIFISRLRDEKKFENLDELKAQLVNDKKMCLELMHSPL